MRKVDLAYTAGIIDGEGAICIIKNKDSRCTRGYNYRLVVQVSMGEPEICNWLCNMFGGHLFVQNRKYATYSVEITGWCLSARQSLRFLHLILPYLKGKRKQAQIAIKFQNKKKLTSYISDATVAAEAHLFEEIRKEKKSRQIIYEENEG